MASVGRAARVLAPLLGLMLIVGGATKLAGEPHQVAGFLVWGLPTWFRMLVGTFEIIGGVLLLVPAARPVGSLILSTIMVGALWTHVVWQEWSQLVLVTVILTLLLGIFQQTRSRAIRLLGGA
jgi:uncharacterized membrane protein YphA (DoxX/SURF4 family)